VRRRVRFIKAIATAVATFYLMVPLPTRALAQGDAIWERTNGPFGGVVQALAVNASGHIFAGTYGGGIFRSRDHGATWARVGIGLPLFYTGVLAVNASGFIFAGISDGTSDGVFRSTDDGETWAPSGLNDLRIYSLAVSPLGHIFAATDLGVVFRSTDHGST